MKFIHTKLFKYLLIVLALCTIAITVGIILDYHLKDYYEIILFPVVFESVIIYIIISAYDNRNELLDDENIRFAYSSDELIKKYEFENHLSYENRHYPASPLIVPDKPLPLNKLSCTFVESTHTMHPFIFSNMNEVLEINNNSHNAPIHRLETIKEEDGDVIFNFSLTDYYTFLSTNSSPDLSIKGTTIREIIEPGPVLRPIEKSGCSNHFGISMLIKTSDDKFILPRRSQKVSVFKGMLSPSVSGTFGVDVSGYRNDEKWNFSFLEGLKNELKDELSDKIEIEEGLFLGVVREYLRLGCPESFFFCDIKQTEEEVLELISKNENFSLESKNLEFYTEDGLKDLVINKCHELSYPAINNIVLYLNYLSSNS